MPTATKDAPATINVSDKPIFKCHDRGVHVSVFANSVTRKEGTTATFYNSQITARYKDKAGHYQDGSFDEDQLAVLSDLIDEGRRAIRQARAQDKAAAQA